MVYLSRGYLSSGTDPSGSTISGTQTVPVETQLWVGDDVLYHAPTALVVTVMGGLPDADVDFYIDGVNVFTATPDTEGNIFAISVPVPETCLAGVHTIKALQPGSVSSSATFTLQSDPIASPTSRGIDASPVQIPAADHGNGFYQWVLQDLLPGGMGSWVMPINPAKWTMPLYSRPLSAKHTTAMSGQYHVFEGMGGVVEWEFSGYLPDQATHDKLMGFYNLNRRFYVIDHRNRAWITTFTEIDMVPRLTQRWNGVSTEWGHDYTVKAICYDQNPKVPQ